MNFYICTIIKNEHIFLEEWLNYHFSLGFSRIYLFEDFGSDSHSGITSKFNNVVLRTCDEYFVNKRDYDRGDARQNRLYQKVLNEHRGEDAWCAFIDIDEFVQMNNGYTLEKLAQEFNNETGIAMYWNMKGASGHIKRPESNSVLKEYTKDVKIIPQDYHWMFKSFVNLKKAKMFNTLHEIKGAVDENRNTIVSGWKMFPSYKKIQLNHYYTKSFEDWVCRMIKGGLCPNHRQYEGFFQSNEDFDINDTKKLFEELDNKEYWDYYNNKLKNKYNKQ